MWLEVVTHTQHQQRFQLRLAHRGVSIRVGVVVAWIDVGLIGAVRSVVPGQPAREEVVEPGAEHQINAAADPEVGIEARPEAPVTARNVDVQVERPGMALLLRNPVGGIVDEDAPRIQRLLGAAPLTMVLSAHRAITRRSPPSTRRSSVRYRDSPGTLRFVPAVASRPDRSNRPRSSCRTRHRAHRPTLEESPGSSAR